jgi:EAL domain-containing protein (putative c-di-GMP-specific phosphodiesterase class I)
MLEQRNFRKIGCAECAAGAGLGFDFAMAFQPIVHAGTRKVFAQEALARGPQGEPAGQVFRHVNEDNRYAFDQACRVKAIQQAAELEVDSYISINFMPNAVYRPELCIRTTIEAAETYGFPIRQIIFEFTENEYITDLSHVREIVRHYKERGFLTALDDFGAGYAGLNLLADIETDLIKLDMALIRGIDVDRRRQRIVGNMMSLCRELGTQVIAEGIETRGEYLALLDLGVELFQGYYFARPAFRAVAPLPATAVYDR